MYKDNKNISKYVVSIEYKYNKLTQFHYYITLQSYYNNYM